MPSWAPESWKESCRSDLRTVRAARSPEFALFSIAARSTVTRENSAATKNALAAVRSRNASSGPPTVSNAVLMVAHLTDHSAAPRTPVVHHRSSRADLVDRRASTPYIIPTVDALLLNGQCRGHSQPTRMEDVTDNSLDREGNARQALAQIYRDYGRNGLDDGRLVGKLLPDLLGDAPREAALVRTAADNGVAQMLVERLSSGVPVESAARDVSILLSERNAFDRSACDWIVKEYALALGYPVPAAAPLVGLGDPTSIDTAVPRPPAGPTSHPGATPQGGYAPQPGPVASPGGYSPQPGYSPQVGYSPQASFPPQSAQGHPPRSAGGYPPQPTLPYPPPSPGGFAQTGGYAAGPYPYAPQPPPA